jgi:hypothetical protein
MNHNILHICSINKNGLQQSEKRQRLIEWSKQQQCNILLMHIIGSINVYYSVNSIVYFDIYK